MVMDDSVVFPFRPCTVTVTSCSPVKSFENITVENLPSTSTGMVPEICSLELELSTGKREYSRLAGPVKFRSDAEGSVTFPEILIAAP